MARDRLPWRVGHRPGRIIASMRRYYCYILECADGSLYTGLTTDPERRLHQHSSGRGARYTRAHLPVSLAVVEDHPDLRTAMRRERALKALPRERKLALLRRQVIGAEPDTNEDDHD
jgi:putative endonuclease